MPEYVLADNKFALTKLYKDLSTLKAGDILDIDLETNGLEPWHGNEIIGYAFGFQALDRWYYVPVAHGVGRPVEIDPDGAALTWANKSKNEQWLSYWAAAYYEAHPETYGNITGLQRDRVKAALTDATKRGVIWRGHNLHFDMTFLYCDYVQPSDTIIDTMLGLHVLHEDLGGIFIDAPVKWSRRHVKDGRCNNADIGQWVRDEDGDLVWENQMANKELKFMSAAFGIPGATEGEDELHAAIHVAEHRLRAFIDQHKQDPMYSDHPVVLDAKSNMWLLTGRETARYAAGDVRITALLHDVLVEKLADWGTLGVWQNDNATLRHVTWEMHVHGFKLDRGELVRQRGIADERKAELLRLIQKRVSLPGEERTAFNPGSSQQLLKVLQYYTENGAWGHCNPELGYPSWWTAEDIVTLSTYGKLKFKPIKRPEPGPDEPGVKSGFYTPKNFTATDEEALYIVRDHPLVRMLTEYRKIVKSVGTYLNNWDKAEDPWGIIHPEFKLGTVSGRLSSSGPAGNFQGIPTQGWAIKRCLTVPYPGWAYVGMDYSQIELRLACHVAEGMLGKDPNMTMTRQFTSGADPHANTRDKLGLRDYLYPGMSLEAIAARLGLTGDPEKAALKALRQVGKTLNFGLLYSGGAPMMAKQLHIEESVAGAMVAAWRELAPAFPRANLAFQNMGLSWKQLPRNPKMQGLYIQQPITGRVRHFTNYRNLVTYIDEDGLKQTYNEKESEARKGFNNIVQGMGGGIANLSAVRARMELGNDLFRPCAVIHDSIDFYTPIATMHEVIDKVRDIMLDWDVTPQLAVGVEVSYTNWQDAEELE